MRPQIVWRNPSPPPNVKFKLHRLARTAARSMYQVASPNYRYPFEVTRVACDEEGGMMQENAELAGVSPAELVSARW